MTLTRCWWCENSSVISLCTVKILPQWDSAMILGVSSFCLPFIHHQFYHSIRLFICLIINPFFLSLIIHSSIIHPSIHQFNTSIHPALHSSICPSIILLPLIHPSIQPFILLINTSIWLFINVCVCGVNIPKKTCCILTFHISKNTIWKFHNSRYGYCTLLAKISYL